MAQSNPLPPEQAFRFSARLVDAGTVEARFTIADGYYLYRDKLRFSIEPVSAGLRVPELPGGKIKQDEFFGRVETYRGNVVVKLAIQDPPAGKPMVIRAESQGCADLGICYPPNVQQVTIASPDASIAPDGKPAGKKAWFN